MVSQKAFVIMVHLFRLPGAPAPLNRFIPCQTRPSCKGPLPPACQPTLLRIV